LFAIPSVELFLRGLPDNSTAQRSSFWKPVLIMKSTTSVVSARWCTTVVPRS